MTRARSIMLIAAFLFQGMLFQAAVQGQVNNYYNAPPQYQLPGTPTTYTPVQTTTNLQYAQPGTTIPGYGVPATSVIQNYGTPGATTTPGYGAPVTTGYGAPAAGYGTAGYTVPATTGYNTSAGYVVPTSPYTTGASYYPQPGYGIPYNASAINTTGNISTAFNQPSASTAISQVYPQPAQPTVPNQAQPSFTPLAIPVPAYAQVAPPDTLSPGLATINNGKWYITDFLYNLPTNIGVKVQVIKPYNKYVPLSRKLNRKKSDLSV